MKPGKYIARFIDDDGEVFDIAHHIIVGADGSVVETHYTSDLFPDVPATRFTPPREWSLLFLGCYRVEAVP